MKTICSIFASPSAFETECLCSFAAALLGRLQAVMKNKAIDATMAVANNVNTARIGTQTLVGTDPAHQDQDSFRIGSLRAARASRCIGPVSDEDRVSDGRSLAAS